MVRGSGKFKQKRGGGRSFSRNLELDENGTAVAVDRWGRREKDDDDDESSEEEEESEEEESEEETPPTAAAAAPKKELTREERRAQKKQAKAKASGAGAGDGSEEEEDDLLEANTNRAGVKAMKLSEVGAGQPSRREKEAKEKKEAQERYWKLHEAGKTDQAKSDLARLAKIRAEREAAAAKRKAEADAKTAEINKAKEAQKSGKRGF